jgi:hypothetical protein
VGGAPEGMSLPRVFPNLRRMDEYWNLPSINKSLFYFLAAFSPFRKKEILPWEHENI